MKIRHVAKTAGVSAAIATAGALSALTFAGTAGAATQYPNAAAPIPPFTAGTPFSSGQTISVVVPANAILPSANPVKVIECAAPNGVLPTLPTQCDSTSIQGDSLFPNADGSINYTNYQVYALPDTALGGSSPITCGNTAATECVLFIGDDYNDFTAPHVFSQAFKVQVNDAAETGVNPGDGTPEVPLAVGLPLAAAGIMGGLVLRRRWSAKANAA